MFTLRNVRFREILQIDDLTIRDTRVTCIVGRSGSGKTTLIRHLNRLVTPDAGEILFQGQPISEIDPIELRRRVVMLGQTPVMFEGNVRQNVLIGLDFSDREPIADTEVRRLLDLVDLNKPLDAPVEPLSGGEKQRVAIARVLAMRPEVLLLDEPTSALDEGTEREVIGRLVRGARELGVTVVMVTHARNIAQAFADDLIELEAGRVVNRTEMR